MTIAAGVLLGSTTIHAGNKESISLKGMFDLTVVTASKHAEPLDESPNVMYVFTKDDLNKRGITNMKDIFQIVPGFGVHQKDIQFVSQVRGIAPNDNEKVALMVNGHLMNQVTEPDFFQGGAFPLHLAEQVEIIVGPGGVFYGGETLTAIINIITRKIDEGQLAISAGNFGQINGTGMIGKEIDEDVSFFASASYYKRDGFDAWRENSGSGRNRELAGMDDLTGQVHPSYAFFFSTQFQNWKAQYFTQNSQMPDLHLHGSGKAIDGRRYDYINSGIVKNKHELTDQLNGTFELSADLKRTLRSIVEVGDKTGDNPNWDLQETHYGTEYAIQHRTDNNYFQMGMQVTMKQHRHNYDFQWNPDKPYDFTNGDGDRIDNMRSIVRITNTYASGLYLSDKFKLNKKITLVGALRADRNNILDSKKTDTYRNYFDLDKVYLSPRAAIITKPIDNLVLKGMYNRATRLAATAQGTPLNELWGKQQPLAPSWATANGHITKPEILDTYEAQAIYYLADTRLSVNYWHQSLQEYASWFSPRTNVGNFNGDGMEFEIKSKVHEKVTLWLNGAVSKNDFEITANADKTGEDGAEESSAFQLPSNDKGEVLAVPKFTSNFGMQITLMQNGMGNLFLSPTLRYFTGQVMAKPVEGSDEPNYGTADNQLYTDVTLQWQEVAGWEDFDFRVVGKNILNNTELVGTQWMADSYHPEGMNLAAELTYKF